jgi:hypothetical protein
MKFRIVLAFGAGYLLGTKAGRDRYEQLRRAYRRATSNESVRKVIDQSKDIVDEKTAGVRGAVAEQLSTAGEAIRDRADGNGQRP